MKTHIHARSIGQAALVALLAAPLLGAQGRWEDGDQRDARERVAWERRDDDERLLYTWRGNVDDDTRIYMRGSTVESRVVSGADARGRRRVDRDNTLPRRAGVVRVQLVEGRGSVYVVQQPTARNDYTAIVRVKDGQRGTGRYRFAVYFDPADRRVGSRDRVWGDAGGDVYGRSGGSNLALRWRGNVDGELRLTMFRGEVHTSVVYGGEPRNVESSGTPNLRRDGYLTVSLRQGRGTVEVVQQPAAANNYTTILRVVDRPAGYGYYDFDLVWQ
jgi:hypothetical protein